MSMVRNDPKLLDAYDYGLWVTVRHPLDADEFMRRLRKQLGLRLAAAHDDHRDLKNHLKDKRYMIVVDDLHTKGEWDQVWPKLFNLKNVKGSRIIVTTRREDVARHCAGCVAERHSHVYELKPLGDTESMNLLYKKVDPFNPTGVNQFYLYRRFFNILCSKLSLEFLTLKLNRDFVRTSVPRNSIIQF